LPDVRVLGIEKITEYAADCVESLQVDFP